MRKGPFVWVSHLSLLLSSQGCPVHSSGQGGQETLALEQRQRRGRISVLGSDLGASSSSLKFLAEDGKKSSLRIKLGCGRIGARVGSKLLEDAN